MVEPVGLDEQVRRTRSRLTDAPTPAAVADLVPLLLARGILALREDREEEASADLREAADLLAAYPDGALPVDGTTARMVWCSWSARARHEGLLVESLATAQRAVSVAEPFPDDLEPYAGFYRDLTSLTSDLHEAGHAEECAEAARLAFAWSTSLAAAAARYEPTVGITGATFARALADLRRLEDAVAVADETLPVLRRHDLGAIAVSLLDPLGGWLRELGRWDDAVAADGEALSFVRRRTHWLVEVEVHHLLMLSRSLVGAGRPREARVALAEALAVIDAPRPGGIALRPELVGPVSASVRAELAFLD